MAATAEVGLQQTQKPETLSRSPMWVAQTQVLEPLSADFNKELDQQCNCWHLNQHLDLDAHPKLGCPSQTGGASLVYGWAPSTLCGGRAWCVPSHIAGQVFTERHSSTLAVLALSYLHINT